MLMMIMVVMTMMMIFKLFYSSVIYQERLGDEESLEG